MRHVAAVCAVFVGAAICPVTAAQTPPTSVSSSCALMGHPGIPDHDARVASAIACEQLRAVSLPGGHWFALSMAPHGDSLLVCAEERNVRGRTSSVHCAWAAGPKAAAGWAARIAHDFQPKPAVQEPPVVASKSTVVRKSWYGWQTLTVVGVSLLPWAVAIQGTSVPPSFLVAGATGVFLGPPIVHLSHGNWGRALGSFAMGTIPAVVLGGVGLKALAVSCSSPNSGDVEACGPHDGLAIVALFAAIGHTIAYVVADSAQLAWDYGPVRPAPDAAFARPSLGVTRNGATMGLGGSF